MKPLTKVRKMKPLRCEKKRAHRAKRRSIELRAARRAPGRA